jgi:hypothetical protein
MPRVADISGRRDDDFHYSGRLVDQIPRHAATGKLKRFVPRRGPDRQD